MAGHLITLRVNSRQKVLLMRRWERDGQSKKDLVASLGLEHLAVAPSVQQVGAAGMLVRT